MLFWMVLVKEDDEDNSGSEPEELPGAKCTKTKAPPLDAIARLPKIPKVSRMHKWSVEEYGKYDAYLIKKWSFFGFQENDRGYVVREAYRVSFLPLSGLKKKKKKLTFVLLLICRLRGMATRKSLGPLGNFTKTHDRKERRKKAVICLDHCY